MLVFVLVFVFVFMFMFGRDLGLGDLANASGGSDASGLVGDISCSMQSSGSDDELPSPSLAADVDRPRPALPSSITRVGISSSSSESTIVSIVPAYPAPRLPEGAGAEAGSLPLPLPLPFPVPAATQIPPDVHTTVRPTVRPTEGKRTAATTPHHTAKTLRNACRAEEPSH